VYMDGANMNAQVGWTSPGHLGADVCHLNLHKTFAIPHGGGGPGCGPIGVKAHLAPFLPCNPVIKVGGDQTYGVIASAPWGNANLLPITWVYISGLGKEGLRKATAVAILNANYMAHCLGKHYPILYRGKNGRVGHEFIVDFREFEKTAGVTVEDVGKRLIDFSCQTPTIGFPVPGTLMLEPTETEDKAELDRFIEAMIKIREEIRKIETGEYDRVDNPLKNAPHTIDDLTAIEWNHKYSKEEAVHPLPWVKARGKFWPACSRVDHEFAEENACTCLQASEYF